MGQEYASRGRRKRRQLWADAGCARGNLQHVLGSLAVVKGVRMDREQTRFFLARQMQFEGVCGGGKGERTRQK